MPLAHIRRDDVALDAAPEYNGDRSLTCAHSRLAPLRVAWTAHARAGGVCQLRILKAMRYGRPLG
eukprot:23896-Prorocentrum_minimum.AAC.4